MPVPEPVTTLLPRPEEVDLRPVSSWLERFRRAAAVPAAAADDLAVELLPVFAALDEIDADAARIRDAARVQAAAREAAAAAGAERILAAARARAAAERARAEAERRGAATAEAERIVAEARTEVVGLRARGRARVPGLAAEVVASLTEDR